MKHKRRNELRYPGLWRGCVGAWNPGLGPTGLTLRDWSGFGRHGVLTNMSAATNWISSGGRYSLDFDGTNDYVDMGNVSALRPTQQITISAWSPGSTNTRSYLVSQAVTVSPWHNYVLNARSGAGGGFGLNIGGTLRTVSGGSFDGTTWKHVCGTYDGQTMALYLNGILLNTFSVSGSITYSGSFFNTTLGSWIYSLPWTTPGNEFAKTMIDDVHIYNRALYPYEVARLASRRGIAYEMAPRRRSSVLVSLNLNNLMMGSSF
jgi:hypothetical protein